MDPTFVYVNKGCVINMHYYFATTAKYYWEKNKIWNIFAACPSLLYLWFLLMAV